MPCPIDTSQPTPRTYKHPVCDVLEFADDGGVTEKGHEGFTLLIDGLWGGGEVWEAAGEERTGH